jgi:glutathione S-transferase
MYKLIYFNVKGLAETTRVLFAMSGTNYEDYRYNFEVVGGEYKKEEFDKDKEKFECSMGKLPILEIKIGDKVEQIGQSKSIERYLAREFGLMGSNKIEEAKIDSICECIRDIKERYQSIKKTDGINKYFEETIYNELEKLSKVLDNKSKLAVGEKLSLADITIYMFIKEYFDRSEEVIEQAKKIKRYDSIIEELDKHDKLQEWFKQRPNTLF